MWSDNETKDDLIGFRVHAELIRSVVTDPDLLPVVLGVFGDWGGGKSSIMRMLEHELKDNKYKDTVCLYFNGWMFEGYEDAKTALLTSILVQLGEHQNFGPKVKKKVVKLLKRVKWMELGKLGLKHVGLPLITAALTGGAAAIPVAAAGLFSAVIGKGKDKNKEEEDDDDDKDDKDKINWGKLIEKDSGKPDLLEVRKFRDDFEKMLAETDIKSLVILIDDLDRCLPERLIETLEAIKLFVAVKKTAFVIGADPRIVRHAIATRYVAKQLGEDASKIEEYDLVKDYLEKLIQIPYHLPRLSPAEIETYINLLACQKYLTKEHCDSVLSNWASRRDGNFYTAYQYGAIKEILDSNGLNTLKEQLGQQLSWSNAVAPVLTEGLKGNPRQVKRMLNAMLLRKKLAEVAKINVKDEILAKLMVLEYVHEDLFKELNDWQSGEGGVPEKLKTIEAIALANNDKKINLGESFSKWNRPSVVSWLRMQPTLIDIDLRDYFWLARDKTSSTLIGVNMVSPLVRRLFDQLIGENRGEQIMAARETAKLQEIEQEALLQLLQQQVERHPDRLEGPAALAMLIEENIVLAVTVLSTALHNTDATSLDPGIAQRILNLGKSKPDLGQWATDLLDYLKGRIGTRVAKAAEIALKG